MVQSDYIFIESDYEYVLGNFIGQAIRFQALFAQGNLSWAHAELDRIAKELEVMARSFAMSQGIDGSKNQGKFARGHPTVLQGIKAYREYGTIELVSEAKKQTTGVEINEGRRRQVFYNKGNLAKDGKLAGEKEGGYYGGHVEYGHMLPDGGFYPARPYLRPALRVVAESSTGNLAGSLAAVLSGQLSGFDQFTASGEIIRNIAHGQGSVLQFGKRGSFDKKYNRSKKQYEKVFKHEYFRSSGKLGRKYQKVDIAGVGKNAYGYMIPQAGTKAAAQRFNKKYSVRREGYGNNRNWHTGKGYGGESLLAKTRYDKTRED